MLPLTISPNGTVQDVLVDFKMAKCVLRKIKYSWNKYTVPRRRPKGYVRRSLKAVGWEGVDKADLAQGRDRWWALVNTVMNFLVP